MVVSIRLGYAPLLKDPFGQREHATLGSCNLVRLHAPVYVYVSINTPLPLVGRQPRHPWRSRTTHLRDMDHFERNGEPLLFGKVVSERWNGLFVEY